ncbi:MAG: FecR domain-containing protein [Gammaproteobacteria bacterium]|nr:FecR domain-containing protein [Gammaproteobacteria bacterium]
MIHKSQNVLSIVLLLVLSFWSLTAMANKEITVKPGQTIIKIMRQEYAGQRNRWPLLMREMVRLNPSAFINGDPRSLKSGAVIKLPGKTTAKKVSKKRVRAATVYKVVGSVSLFDDKKKIQPIKVGSYIYVGDQLLTSDRGVLRLKFIDGATVKLRCSSLLNIDEYKMRSSGSVSELSLLKGSLRTKSGRIGRRSNDRYLVKTPLGNVSTNKAEYGVRVLQSQACEQQADVDTDGLYLDVLNGKVSLKNAGISVL